MTVRVDVSTRARRWELVCAFFYFKGSCLGMLTDDEHYAIGNIAPSYAEGGWSCIRDADDELKDEMAIELAYVIERKGLDKEVIERMGMPPSPSKPSGVRARILAAQHNRPLESPLADLPVEGPRYCVACGDRLHDPVHNRVGSFVHRSCAEDRGLVPVAIEQHRWHSPSRVPDRS